MAAICTTYSQTHSTPRQGDSAFCLLTCMLVLFQFTVKHTHTYGLPSALEGRGADGVDAMA
jgi:hypothetical protein